MLSGPPGTGKTMTAHVIAGELGLPLYQVDLSRVMDKYIGETEKHLEEIFSFAEKTNVVLLFDEADALFGKRGEVTEGKDRYANMEVAYILQRIEQFEGIVILSTNFYHNIDKAFLRRMKYVLQYRMPDETLRRRLWESSLPEKQCREELDIDYLAAQFEFTGGMIKNVILSACVKAIYEKSQLSMEHLLQAIRAEYEKMEWPVSDEIWGEYEYLIM
ncbi:MAG: ATP-binding protein [Lachnospiraceae bacterium]|nr:ATP-binding protein [Lachnospiraceae bacterium]